MRNSMQTGGDRDRDDAAARNESDSKDVAPVEDQTDQPQGFLGGILDKLRGAGETAREAADDAEERRSTNVGGGIGGVIGLGEAADEVARKQRRQEQGPAGGVLDIGDAARDVATGGGASGGGGENKWDRVRPGVTTDASGRVIGPDGQPIGEDTTQHSAPTGQDDEWTSISGSEGGVGTDEYYERLRKGHEAAGGDYASDLRSADDVDDTKPV